MRAFEQPWSHRGKGGDVESRPVSERFDVIGDSSLTFFATSTVLAAFGKTTQLSGYIDAAWNPDGTLAAEPVPRAHIEFMVETLRTGYDLQDQEMWRLIDSKRFPKVFADLREFRPGVRSGATLQRVKLPCTGWRAAMKARLPLAGTATA